MNAIRLKPAAALTLAALLGCLCVRSDAALRPRFLSPRLAGLPRLTVWAWERREDLVVPLTLASAAEAGS